MSAVRKSSNRSSKDKEAAPISFDYDYLLRLCRKHWMWLAGGTIMGIIGGVIYASFQIPIYSAQATIFVPATDTSVVNTDGGAQPDFGGDMIKTFEQLLQTRDLVEAVVTNEKLNENPDFIPDGATAPMSIDSAAGMLAGMVDIHIRNPTRLIDISVENPSAKMAAYLANAVAKEAVNQQMKHSNQGSNVLSDYLQKEVDRLRAQLADREAALEAYKVSHNIVGGTDSTPDSAADTQLKELNQELQNAEMQVTLLSERYGPEHPKLIQAQETVDELHKEVAQAQSAASDSSANDTGYAGLKSEVDSYTAQLASMEKELRNADTSANVSIPGLRVVEEANPPNVPVRPAKRKIVAAGGFIGLLCGAAFVLALYFLDSSVRTVSQAENTFGLPVIAAVPILSESDGKSVLPTFSDPQSFVAEAFRGLRASLILQDRETPLKTILVVSAIPGEGKSFCAANLAVAFAQAGLKTLLIDADLRLPTLHNYFQLPGDSCGFTDVLTGRGTLDTSAIQSQVPALRLLLTTIAADSPAELLSTHRLPMLLEEAAPRYDRIVIDSAPLNPVSDTMLIMPKADAILLVVRASQTPASETKAAIEKISSSKMKPLGLILNYLAPHTLKAYSYGYSYGQKPKAKNAK